MWQGAWWGSFLDGQGERFHLLIKRVKQCQLSTISVPNIHEPPEPDPGPSGDLEEEIENFGKELKDFFQRGIGQ